MTFFRLPTYTTADCTPNTWARMLRSCLTAWGSLGVVDCSWEHFGHLSTGLWRRYWITISLLWGGLGVPNANNFKNPKFRCRMLQIIFINKRTTSQLPIFFYLKPNFATWYLSNWLPWLMSENREPNARIFVKSMIWSNVRANSKDLRTRPSDAMYGIKWSAKSICTCERKKKEI